MRFALVLAAGLCALHLSLAAQDPDVIEWSSERRLRRQDFRGRPPAGAAQASMSFLNIEASWECAAGELHARVRATFDPASSWWRAGSANSWADAGTRGVGRVDARGGAFVRDAQLLEHEQIHFDLAELAARRVRARFDELKNACTVSGDADPARRVVEEIERELQEEQLRYDRETAHGIDARAQNAWARRVRTELNRAPSPGPPSR